MAKIDSFNFGFIVIDGKQYIYDILIMPDGTVKEREASKAKLGSHTITRNEIMNIINQHPETLVIGTGASGLAQLTADAVVYLQRTNVRSVVQLSSQAVQRFNELVGQGKKAAALIHITC